MPITIVHCSEADCPETASAKIAAPWSYGSFAELKTFGYACPGHADTILDRARPRLARVGVAEGETMGKLSVFDF